MFSKTLPDQRTDKNECLKRTKKAGKKMETLRTPIQNPGIRRIRADVKTYLDLFRKNWLFWKRRCFDLKLNPAFVI